MANQFLNLSVIPGPPIAHHEHKKLLIILGVVILSTAIVLAYFMVSMRKPVPEVQPVPVVEKPSPTSVLISQLHNASKATPSQVNAVLKSLSTKESVSASSTAVVLEKLQVK